MRIKHLLHFIICAFLFCFITSSIHAATYTVTKTADTNDGTCDADCSLREAIEAANSNVGFDTINFNIPTSDGGYVSPSGDVHGYFLIDLATQLVLTDDNGVYINGYSQPGSSRNTATFGQTLNNILKIQVFFNFTNSANFSITSDNNHISGLNIRTLRNNTNVINLDGSSNNWIEGNYIGSNIVGSSAENGGSFYLTNNSNNNIFGTNGDGNEDVGEKNLFMSNTTTINNPYIAIATGNGLIIAGNYMGVDKTTRNCTSALVQGSVIYLGQSSTAGSGHRIGSNYDGISDSEESNILACVNSTYRGEIRIAATSNSYIQGNYIGTNTYGDTFNTSNDRGGLVFRDSASTNIVVKRNVIANNNSDGVIIESSISASTAIRLTQNKIYNNGTLGIDLANDGVITANDIGDGDTGPNNLMNFPVLRKIVRDGNNLVVTADLDFNPSEGPFTIELFDNDVLDGTGYGEGQYYIGSVTTSTIGTGVIFIVPITDHVPTSAARITSTATNNNGSTSEFSTIPTDTTLHIAPNSIVRNLLGSTTNPPICSDVKPEYAPKLFQINTTHNAATLYFAPSGANTTKYFISYGHNPGEELYGVEYNENSVNSALSYTIHELNPNTRYYFKVRGGNGCMPGDWSNNVYGTTTQNEFSLQGIFTAWEQMKDVVLSWVN